MHCTQMKRIISIDANQTRRELRIYGGKNLSMMQMMLAVNVKMPPHKYIYGIIDF